MTQPRHPNGASSRLRIPLSLAAFVVAGVHLPGQVPSIPLVNQVAEVEQNLTAKNPAAAASLLDEIIKRAQAGETLPAGVTLDKLLLAAANTNFQIQKYDRAAELGAAVEKVPSIGASAQAEARMITGLALALQQKYAEAVPVFEKLEESKTYRDKALL